MNKENASPISSRVYCSMRSHVGLILLGGLCLGCIGAAYGAFLHFHPEYKEKIIYQTLSEPHFDNYYFLASAQAIRHMGFWGIVVRKSLALTLLGCIIGGVVAMIIARKTHRIPNNGEEVKTSKSPWWLKYVLIALAILLLGTELFGIRYGSGMVWHQGHHQFYWCRQLESEDDTQRMQTFPAACSLLRGKPFVCRTRMLTALANCGDDAKETIPVLVELLQDREPMVAAKAAWALTKMGPDANAAVKSAVPKLEELLRNEKSMVRLVAAEALGNTGPEGKAAALPVLKELRFDEDGHIRLAAEEILAENAPSDATANE